MTWTICLPLRVPVTKKKLWSLNLNQFRNTHFQTLNKAKTTFEKEVGPLLRGIPKLKTITLEYVVYAPNKQLFDTNNICSIVDKFFSDTLVTCGVIEDDNYNIVVDSRFRPGGIDKGNPRVEVTIRSPDYLPSVKPEPLKEEEPVMQIKTKTVIVLSPDDLAKALRVALAKHVNIPDDAELRFAGLTSDLEVTIETGGTPALVQASKPVKTEKPVIPATTKSPVEEVLTELDAADAAAEAAEKTPAPAAPKASIFTGFKKPSNA